MIRFPVPAYSLILAAALCCSACAPVGDTPLPSLDRSVPRHDGAQEGATLTRANPGQVHWLEGQSLLYKTRELAAVVSGSSLPWNAPSARSDYAGLLDRADVWFHFNPLYAAWQGNTTALAALADSGLPAGLEKTGIKGIYFSPLAESGLTYGVDNALGEQAQDLVSFETAQVFGGDAAYARVEGVALRNDLWLAGDLLPSATGLGPDFALATKGVREYPGLFMMVEIPQDKWDLLPLQRYTGSSAGQFLHDRRVEGLAETGLIPPAFSRDADTGFAPSGWAATPESAGIDGVTRRWVYRYVGSPLRPVLNWDDPSGTARRVLSASIIQQVGMLHQPLVGISVEALWGQDPSPVDRTLEASPEPALSALRALSREARRYGAWSMLKDAMPPRLLPLLQDTEVDFCRDTVTSPQLEYAMLTGDTEPLKRAIDESLKAGVNHARLWRQTADPEGIRFDLAGLSGKQALETLARRGGPGADGAPLEENTLYITAATLASVASRADQAQTAAEAVDRIKSAHLLQVAFRAMQPGLLFLTGQDMEGSLTGNGAIPSQVGWSLDGTSQLGTRHGLPADTGVYPPFAAQLGVADSFVGHVRELLAIRERTRVASGSLAGRAVMGVKAAVGVVTRLPDGAYLLCAGNFSNSSFTTDVTLPANLIRPGEPAWDQMTGHGVAVAGNRLQLTMEPWQYRIVLFHGR